MPGTWRTWATGQEIDAMPRISIRLLLEGMQPLGLQAGDGRDAPTYSDLVTFSPGWVIELGYSFSVAWDLFFCFRFVHFAEKEADIPPADGSGEPTRRELNSNQVFVGSMGVKFRLPLTYRLSRMFRFSRIEAPEGFSLYLKFAVGMAKFDEWWIEWEEQTGTGSMETHDAMYFAASTNPFFQAAFGIVYRWVHFSLFFEVGAMNFGTPSPSEDPDWADHSKAANLVTAGFQVGLAAHF
jgi:hypothetical protein